MSYGFFLVLPGKFRNSILDLRREPFISDPFHLIINYFSSNNCTL